MVHLFEEAGMRMALDVGSGAVHVLDAPAYALLNTLTEDEIRAGAADKSRLEALLNTYGKIEIEAALLELAALATQGLLYVPDDYSAFEGQLGPAPIKAMCLHLAHDCNLRCRYCFASTGGFGGQRSLMSLETARAAIGMLVRESGSRRNLEVDFFGGEPMLNYDVLTKTVAYARSLEAEHDKNFRFTVTTNGLTLNDENIEFINREMSNVVLSIDGRQEVNDRLRVRVDGSGSYDAIVPKFQKLVAGRKDKEYYVRGTYTKYNLDFDKDVLALYELGFDQISVEPVVGPREDDYAIQPEHLPQIRSSYRRLMAEMAGRRKNKKKSFNFFHFMVDLQSGPCAIKRLRGCGSGNEYVAVTPDGEIYPCHQFVGNPAFVMGDVEKGITRPEMKNEFANANLLHKASCQNCWAKYFCSGGCNANNHTYAGSILSPHEMSCELEKMRLESAIALQALLAE